MQHVFFRLFSKLFVCGRANIMPVTKATGLFPVKIIH
jgi:hypothetical protein